MNLITNAVEAIGDQVYGTIRLATSREAVGPGARGHGAENLAEGDCVRLEIKDTGSGMAEEVRVRIFDPFFTTKFLGRGLGLATVQGIVRRHGGGIHVSSTLGLGTEVHVLLSVGDGPAGDQVGMEPTSVKESRPGKPTVLFVEDEESFRTPVTKMLRRKGFSVIEAEDGAAAIEHFRANRLEIGVVLLDLTLPGLPGREVFMELRQIQPDVKVILTTAYSREVAMGSFEEEPAVSGFIRKPYRLDDLMQLLREALAS
jgi:CheY-like chemotaxis protein